MRRCSGQFLVQRPAVRQSGRVGARESAMDLIRGIAPPATAADRIAIAQTAIDDASMFDDIDAYALALILSTARVCERDQTAQRVELRALVKLHATHDLADGLARLAGISRPTGDHEQDRQLAALLSEPYPPSEPS